MRSLIKLHRKYLRTKVNLIIIIIMLFIVSIGLMVSINPFEIISVHDLNRKSYALNYQTNMHIMMKMTIVLISCYLFGSSFCKSQDNYAVLYLSSNNKRTNRIGYFLTKYYAIAQVLFFICLFLLLIYLIIGYLGSSWFVIDQLAITFFSTLFVQGLVYGTIAAVLSLLLNNWFSSLIPYVIFIVSEIINEYTKSDAVNRIFHFFFPVIVSTDSEVYFTFGIGQALIMLTSFVIVALLIFFVKDIN